MVASPSEGGPASPTFPVPLRASIDGLIPATGGCPKKYQKQTSTGKAPPCFFPSSVIATFKFTLGTSPGISHRQWAHARPKGRKLEKSRSEQPAGWVAQGTFRLSTEQPAVRGGCFLRVALLWLLLTSGVTENQPQRQTLLLCPWAC